MSKLLHIEASPRKERSHSIHVAQAFLEAYRSAHPGDEVETLDLWAADLPEFDGDAINAKYKILHGQEHTQAEAEAWQRITAVAQPLLDADKVLLSIPMWNFGIPYKLKQYLDIIIQPGLTFSFSPDTGYSGLVTGKPIAVIYAQGSAYEGEMSGLDFQSTYTQTALGFIGFANIKTITVAPTLAAPDALSETRSAAVAKAEEIAKAF